MTVGVSNGDDDVVSFLQHAGERYKEHKELLRRKHLEDERKKCPFKPTVSGYAEQVSRQSNIRRSDAITKRLHELHAKRLQTVEAQRVKSRKRQEEEMTAEMRAPQVTERARSLVSRDPVDVSRKWLEKREEKFARLREEALRRELATLREVPRISQYAQEKSIVERHLGQRIEDYFMAKEEARRERMYWLAEKSVGMNSSFSSSSFFSHVGDLPMQNELPQPPFTPRITEYAKQLRRSGNVVDRLLADGRKGRRTPQDTSCTFAPRVAPASLEMSRSYYSDPNILVYERLYRNDASKLREMRRKRMEMDLQNDRTGIPRISETSRLIVERKRSEAMEQARQKSPTQRLHSSSRDAHADARERQRLMEARERKEKENCTFKPRLNAASKKMWRHQLQLLQGDSDARTAAAARELLWKRSQKRMDEEIRRRRAMVEAREMAECTFHPKVGRAPERRVDRELSVSDRNEMWQLQRAQRLRQTRMELERTQLSECSFHPTVDPVFPLPAHDASAVSGYEAHILRQEESRRRKQEAQDWWRPKVVPPGGHGASRHNLSVVSEPRSSHQRKQRNLRSEGQPRALFSPRSRDDSLADMDGTQFVVYQAPSCASSVSPRSVASVSPPSYKHHHHHRNYHGDFLHSSDNGIAAAVQSAKPSPVDFMINHHRAILDSSRRR
ncbi:hypothetical protein TCSYLVIO_006471 [Trypanosoma cruzi]|nr:hypothetical protein TCSYLVIO_006471 [Trypanosoma cruzi]